MRSSAGGQLGDKGRCAIILLRLRVAQIHREEPSRNGRFIRQHLTVADVLQIAGVNEKIQNG